MRSVLVPLDGSELAEKALPVADRLLQGKKDVGLRLLRVLETPRLPAWLPAGMLDLNHKEREEVEEYLRQLAENYQGRGYEVKTDIGDGPGPVEAVLDRCEKGRAQLIVMSSHGRGGWVRSMLGSNAEKIVRLSKVPVLVVKGEVASKFGTIVVPLDGSEQAEKALPEALNIAPGGDARVVLVGVSVAFQGHAFEGDMRMVVEPDMNRIRNYLSEKAEWLTNQGYEVQSLVRQGSPEEEILKVAKEEQADLILLTSEGRSLAQRLWHFGSTAERVLRHAERPVLILR